MARPEKKMPKPEPPDIKKDKEQHEAGIPRNEAEKLAKESQQEIVKRAVEKRFGERKGG